MPEPSPEAIDAFISKWSRSGGHERGSGQYFLLDVCDLLGLEKPAAPVPENELNAYTFERRVDRRKPDGTTAPNWIDLYKSGHFVLETKQGVNARRDKSDPDQPLLPALAAPAAPKSAGHGQRGSAMWDKALERAHKQAERYIHLLPTEEGRPPFLIVCDVGHCFDLYAEFSGTGGQYEAFPDPRSRRILLKDFHRQEVRDLFRKVWHDPRSLDPSKHAAAVTREVAKALADLARSLDKDRRDPQVTAAFLQRCLFTMFAEDIGLLPKDSFVNLLRIAKDRPEGFPVMLHGLWREMDTGCDFSLVIQEKILPFNGGLFKDTTALPLRPDQIVYLLHAAKQDWAAVEPAIFGTLLERALDPRERHKLGAHYTPRSYVERLVRPTIIEPLREKWEAVKLSAAQLDDKGKTKEARAAVKGFHDEIAQVRVLDPACGSGNFLYVALELLKRLEAEVLDLYEQLGGNRQLEMDTVIIRPGNFLGIELNPRAAAIAQLVLWIGYFQWHRRTTGRADTNERPLLPKENSIECRDAVLDYDEKIPRRDPATGEIVTIWDGRTTKPHPVTGKEVPDETARTVVFDYVNPRRAEWPTADYVVGNPPFIGKHRMREALGDGYVEALRAAWKKHDPDAWDLVMFWWQRAGDLLQHDDILRFGFITTNSIHQTFNRRVLESFMTDKKTPLHLAFAIPDHPWVDSTDGANVRISMTVADVGMGPGYLEKVIEERVADAGENDVVVERKWGLVSSNLKIGADVGSALPLRSNEHLSNHGVIRGGEGFLVEASQLDDVGFRTRGGIGRHLRPIRNGSDLTGKNRGQYVIDLFGLNECEVRDLFPEVYQWIYNRVRPERLKNKRASRRENWWLFNESVPKLRKMIAGIDRYVSTSETAKHRVFVFLDHSVLPEHKLVNIAVSDGWQFGVVSSSVHVRWSLATGARLEDRPVYVKSSCFETYPFPALEEGPLKSRIRELGERLDGHRKGRQAAHPELTLTGMYNVLEKLRAGEALNDKEKKIHDAGLVTLLKQIHDELDAAVLEAYGWEDLLSGSSGVRAPLDAGAAGSAATSDGLGTKCDGHRPTLQGTPFADRLARGGEAAEALEQELLSRLVALNHERAAEEKRGLVRWLRPEYQAPATPAAEQTAIDLPDAADEAAADEAAAVGGKAVTVAIPWPESLPGQMTAILRLLPVIGPDAGALAGHFGKRTKQRVAKVEEILETLQTLGRL